MSKASGIEITGEMRPGFGEILSPDALNFVAALMRRHRARRHELMAYRRERQQAIDAGALPGFLPETAHIPVLALTARMFGATELTEEEGRIEFVLLQGNDLIEKRLLAAITRLFRRTAGSR